MILDIWAQENTNMNSCKTITLFRDIVHRYHPEFKSKSMLKLVEKHPKIFNIGHLIELTMAEVGGYDVVDAHGYDFSDGTECKTASVTSHSLVAPRGGWRIHRPGHRPGSWVRKRWRWINRTVQKQGV